MVVKKGTPVAAKKKSPEEMKNMTEKIKIMMEKKKEESEEEETSEEGSESGDDQLHVDEGSEGDTDEDDSDEDDGDEEDDDDEDDDDDEEDVSDMDTNTKQQKGQSPGIAKSGRSPNKSVLNESSTKTPNKKKNMAQNESPKKVGKLGEELVKTPSPYKQKDSSVIKNTTEKRKREIDVGEGASKRTRTEGPGREILSTDQKRERDLRSLFIRNFPADTTIEELKALSRDIVFVRIPFKKRKGKSFAFVEFSSEKKAEENFTVLQKAEVKGRPLFVDYAGQKSKNVSVVHDSRQGPSRPENKKRIFISGLSQNTTIEDIAKAFPTAICIFIKSAWSSKIANVDFDTESAGEEAYQRNSDLKIKGQAVSVQYNQLGRKKSPKKQAARAQKRSNQLAQSKKPVSKNKDDDKSDEEDDDDESDDESDDDDDDDEGSDE